MTVISEVWVEVVAVGRTGLSLVSLSVLVWILLSLPGLVGEPPSVSGVLRITSVTMYVLVEVTNAVKVRV